MPVSDGLHYVNIHGELLEGLLNVWASGMPTFSVKQFLSDFHQTWLECLSNELWPFNHWTGLYMIIYVKESKLNFFDFLHFIEIVLYLTKNAPVNKIVNNNFNKQQM
ncbi:hypothetical protein ACF0H5_023609 [Mactra antiquata]